MNTIAARIDAILDGVLAREAGWVNNPDDAGGPTNRGITLAEYSDYLGRPATLDELRDLTAATAKQILRDRYVNKPGYNRVMTHSARIAAELIDTGVNMGPKRATTMLQRSLNVLNQQARLFPDLAVDGAIGGLTLSALETFLVIRRTIGEQVLLKALNCLQGAAYIELAEKREKDEEFVYGWLRVRVTIPQGALA